VGEDNAELSPIPTTKKPPPKPLYLDVHDVGVIAFYNEDGVDYTEVEMHVNGVLAKGGCQMKLREDGVGKAFFLKHAVHQVCFAKEHLRWAISWRLPTPTATIHIVSSLTTAWRSR
jgi:hypothetical protein